jgi:hypothetical protein
MPNPLGKVGDDQNPGCEPLTNRKSVPTIRVPPISEKGVCTITELKTMERKTDRGKAYHATRTGGNGAGGTREAAFKSGTSEWKRPR